MDKKDCLGVEMLDGVKKIIPLRLKQGMKDRILGSRLESMLKWTINPVQNEKSVSVGKSRPCVKSWPTSMCECDMHLGAFKQIRRYEKIVRILDDNEVGFVDDIFEDDFHLAVDLDDLPKAKVLLSEAGVVIRDHENSVGRNQYDFPLLRDGRNVSDLVPESAPLLKAVPHYFCASREADADVMAVTISTFNDIDGIRCFHSSEAKTRTQKIHAGARVENKTTAGRERQDIDVVITTVDGTDPAWRDRFDAFTATGDAGTDLVSTKLARTQNEARFVNHDELRYVLRSIYYYAPYVRKIFLVTDRQCPNWLDISHPRIELIDHSDIIDGQYLPTFNSDAIESCLWKIPGLSEKFLYFNDDVLLMGPTGREIFFTDNGLPRFFPSPRSLPDMPVEWAKSYTTHAHIQTALAFEAKGLERPGKKFKHAPFSCVKSVLKEIEKKFEKELHVSRGSHIRSEESYATISFLYPNYALATGKGICSGLKYNYVDLAWGDWEPRLMRILGRTDISVACINESDDASGMLDLDETLAHMLNARFPAIPSWEKQADMQHDSSVEQGPA